MKLYYGRYIVPGLVIFLVIVTFPMWSSVVTRKPNFENPIKAAQDEQCIESKEYMRAEHMKLLNRWRDEVVREGNRVYVARRDGKKWNKSLTKTCMVCHGKADKNGKSTTAATYCNDCHSYVGVKPYCWDCHIDPVALLGKEAK